MMHGRIKQMNKIHVRFFYTFRNSDNNYAKITKNKSSNITIILKSSILCTYMAQCTSKKPPKTINPEKNYLHFRK